MEYHYLYQIVSLVPDENGVCKIYSGVRSSEVEPEIDEYFGSGIWITRAVEKNGRDKFIKTIVARFDTREAAYDCETQWLNKLFTKVYGSDWTKFNRHHYNLRLNEGSNDGGSFSVKTLQKMSDAKSGVYDGVLNPMYGRTHTDEARQKQRDAAKGKTEGVLNPMYGRGGASCPGFKGISVGTNITTGKTIVFDGKKSVSARGFNHARIGQCVLGKSPHHKNFTFIRTTDPDYLRQLLAEDNFHDEQSKQVIQNFLQ